MKALVIGANGFLGRNILANCSARGWRTEAVYHRTNDCIPPDCIAFPVSKLGSCATDYDVVFLVAAAIPYGSLNSPSKELLEANVKLVLTTVSRFEHAKIVFASSVSVYGTPVGTIHEQSPFNAPNMYGLSKLAGEFIVRQHDRYAILRYSSLYGRGMTPDTFLPRIIQQAGERGIITLYGNGERCQDYLHVSDAAELALSAARTEKNGIYLGVNGTSVSNLDAAQAVQTFFPACIINFTGVDNSPSFIYDNSFTREELDFSPQHSLAGGIKELCTNEP